MSASSSSNLPHISRGDCQHFPTLVWLHKRSEYNPLDVEIHSHANAISSYHILYLIHPLVELLCLVYLGFWRKFAIHDGKVVVGGGYISLLIRVQICVKFSFKIQDLLLGKGNEAVSLL